MLVTTQADGCLLARQDFLLTSGVFPNLLPIVGQVWTQRRLPIHT
jgi:hypothetical protein